MSPPFSSHSRGSLARRARARGLPELGEHDRRDALRASTQGKANPKALEDDSKKDERRRTSGRRFSSGTTRRRPRRLFLGRRLRRRNVRVERDTSTEDHRGRTTTAARAGTPARAAVARRQLRARDRLDSGLRVRWFRRRRRLARPAPERSLYSHQPNLTTRPRLNRALYGQGVGKSHGGHAVNPFSSSTRSRHGLAWSRRRRRSGHEKTHPTGVRRRPQRGRARDPNARHIPRTTTRTNRARMQTTIAARRGERGRRRRRRSDGSLRERQRPALHV